MKVVVCGHCRTRVAPKGDGGCPACGCPVDGSPPAQPRTIELGRPFDDAAARRFPLAATAAVFAAHRIRKLLVHRRRDDAVPGARVHGDERG